VIDENAVEELVVVGGQPEDGVLEKRECDAVGGAELAEEVVAPREQRLEAVECGADLRAQLGDPGEVRLGLLELVGDRVRLLLPDAVEPVDKKLDLSPPGDVGREERRLGRALFEQRDNRRRVADDLVAVDEHRHERLAAHRLDRRSVGGIDVDPLDRETFVPRRERDTLDIGRERDSVHA
jgi:hypothetical protein